MKKKIIIVSGVVAFILIAAILFFKQIVPIIPLMGVDWQEKELSYTNEFGNQISVELQDKGVQVYKDGVQIWKSPQNYMVQDVIIADIDKATQGINSPEKRLRENEEIILLLWKKGRFGRHKPFWLKEEKEETIFSQHIFIYNIVPEGVRSKWGSSYMGMIAKEISYDNEVLAVMESDNKITYWKWNSWGFVKQ